MNIPISPQPGAGFLGDMKKDFNKYPFEDGILYKPFRYDPVTLLNLETQAKKGTTYVGTDPMPIHTPAAELLIEAAVRKCDTENREYAYDSTLIRKIREMGRNELILAIHGYFDGELLTIA